VVAMSYDDSETTSSLALLRFLSDRTPDAAE